MARKDYYRNSYNTYIDGNTVRREQAVPQREPAPRREPVPGKSREQIERERERRLAAKRNREHAMSMGRGHIVFLTAATLVCCIVCGLFIYLQSNITTRMSSITSLETQLNSVKSDNASAENRLETVMTLDEIREKADELGMVYPSSDQIQYYSVESSDYMNQYGDVASR